MHKTNVATTNATKQAPANFARRARAHERTARPGPSLQHKIMILGIFACLFLATMPVTSAQDEPAPTTSAEEPAPSQTTDPSPSSSPDSSGQEDPATIQPSSTPEPSPTSAEPTPASEEPTQVASPQGAPDLEAALMPPANVGQSARATVTGTIQNRGGASEEATAIVDMETGAATRTVHQFTIPPLAEGEAYDFDFETTAPIGLARFVLQVSADGSVPDADASNNRASTWIQRAADRPSEAESPIRFETEDGRPEPRVEYTSTWEDGEFKITINAEGRTLRALVNQEWLESRLGPAALVGGRLDSVSRGETAMLSFAVTGDESQDFVLTPFTPSREHAVAGRGSLSSVLMDERPMQVRLLGVPDATAGSRTLETENGTVTVPTMDGDPRLRIDFDDANPHGQPLWVNAAWLASYGITRPLFEYKDHETIPNERMGDHFLVRAPHFTTIYVRDDDNSWEAYYKIDNTDDEAMKVLEVPTGTFSGATSATLWIWARASGPCPSGASMNFMASSGWTSLYTVPFNPCDHWSTTTPQWYGFNIPLSYVAETSMIFKIEKTTGSWTDRNLLVYVDTNTDYGRSSIIENGVDKPGELMWHLAVEKPDAPPPSNCEVAGPDAGGYTCLSTTYSWQSTSTGTTVSLSDDSATGAIALPFTYTWYGSSKSYVYIGSNGMLCFTSDCTTYNPPSIPGTSTPNDLVACFWEDLNPGTGGTIRYKTVGSSPSRIFVVEYNAVPHYSNGITNTFQIHLKENGDAACMYSNVQNDADGASTASGTENSGGTAGIRYRYGEFAATNLGVLFKKGTPPAPPPNNVPTLTAEGSTNYATDGLHPEAGTASTTFQYKVKYTDADNQGPSYIRVHIDGDGGRTMSYASGSNTAGAIYTYTTSFSGGTHSYHFETSDGTATARWPSSGDFSAPTVTNTAPTLAFAGTTGYTTDGVEPNTGFATTTFVYRVKYTDTDATGNPAYVRVIIDNGAAQTMTWLSGSSPGGAIYTYSTTRARGSHTYYFTASDGTTPVQLPTSGSYSGPTVSNSAPNPCFNTAANGLTVTATSCSTDADTTDTLSYTWNWGDATPTGSGNPASHTYVACPGGTWTITMTVSDGNGGSTSTTRTVSPVDLDNDGDGLKNCQETGTYGTNPNIADTDADGLNDGLEVNTYATNPLVQDTDADGLNDGPELTWWNTIGSSAWNTNYDRFATATNNLLKLDSDGDGIKDSYEFVPPASIFGPNAPSSTGSCSSVGGRNECPSASIRDLYIQLNWLNLPPSNCVLGTCLTPGHSDGPAQTDIDAFRGNFDGWNGAAGRPNNDKLRLHLFVGRTGDGNGAVGAHTNEIVMDRNPSTTGAWDDFYDYKDAAFPAARQGYFLFGLFAHNVVGQGSSGQGELFGNDHALYKAQLTDPSFLLGVWMQEVGHNLLGQHHSLCNGGGHVHNRLHNPQATMLNLIEHNGNAGPDIDEGSSATGVCGSLDQIQDVFAHANAQNDAMGRSYVAGNTATSFPGATWLALKPASAQEYAKNGWDDAQGYEPHHHHDDDDHVHTIFDAVEGVTKVLGPRRVANTLPTDKP